MNVFARLEVPEAPVESSGDWSGQWDVQGTVVGSGSTGTVHLLFVCVSFIPHIIAQVDTHETVLSIDSVIMKSRVLHESLSGLINHTSALSHMSHVKTQTEPGSWCGSHTQLTSLYLDYGVQPGPLSGTLLSNATTERANHVRTRVPSTGACRVPRWA